VCEKLARFWACYRSGRANFPVGLVKSGKAFSAEQALLDLEMAQWIQEFGKGIAVNDENLCLDLIRQQGIGGNFIGEEHTVRHMRKAVWYPKLMDRTLPSGLADDRRNDMLERAHARYQKVKANAHYEIDADGRRAIADILRSAERVLTA